MISFSDKVTLAFFSFGAADNIAGFTKDINPPTEAVFRKVRRAFFVVISIWEILIFYFNSYLLIPFYSYLAKF
ncbi:hypothetical protein D3C86_2141890 [compost metagenome]